MTTPTQQASAAGPWERWGWLMAVVWLVFLFYPGLELARSEAPGALRILGWVGLAAFAVSYVTGFIVGMRAGWRSPGPLVYWLYGAAILSALTTVPAIGWNATSFLPFLMAYAAYGMSKQWHWGATLGSLVLVSAHVIVSLQERVTPPWVLVGIIVLMAVINNINTFLIDRSVRDDRLRVDLATSEQRESIARDVHDVLGHSLTVIKLKSELAAKLVERDPAAARAELEEIIELASEAISGVRGTVTGLREQTIEQQLNSSVAALSSAGIRVRVDGSPDALSPAQGLSAAWVLREATTNVLRHSRATAVDVTIQPGILTISDNGVGLTPDATGNGIRGMTERAGAAGATLTIRNLHPERGGTSVNLVW